VIAVTGATGWLGRAVLERLTAAGRPFAAFASRPREVALADGTPVAVRALADLPATPHDALVHFAFLTREHAATLGVGAYVAANLRITATVLEAIARQRPAVAYASSGAVYEPGGALATDLDANPYGTLKHLDELALRQAAADRGRSCAVARVFNLAGPHIVKPRGFALSDLVLQAREQDALEIRARHPVLRSYVDVDDLAALLLALLGAGEDAIFDTAGTEEVEVGGLARRIAAQAGRADLPIHREPDLDAPADRYVGDGSEWARLCARHGITPRPLDKQIARTAAYLATCAA
jgi:nucleoside-diphosphate-sugar epimerase